MAVFVLDRHKKPLIPGSEKRARLFERDMSGLRRTERGMRRSYAVTQ